MTSENRGLLIGLALGMVLCWGRVEAQAPPPPSLPPLPPVSAPPAVTTPTSPTVPNALPPAAPNNQGGGPAPATITVMVPPNAVIWVADQQMKQTGSRRTFQSPPLDPSKTYVYTMKISWPGAPGQKDNSTEQEVTVRSGQTTIIDFTPLAQGVASGPTTTTTPASAQAPPTMPSSQQPRNNGFFRRTGGTKP